MTVGQDTAVGHILPKGGQAAGEMAQTAQLGAMQAARPDGPESHPLDVWTHSYEGLQQQVNSAAENPTSVLSGNLAQYALASAKANDLAHSSVSQTKDSMTAQFNALGDSLKAVQNANGALQTAGASFAFLTSVEQMLSSVLSAIPFPAFPAARIADFDIGLPHAHNHPPNAPPAPPVPLPSTGPVIPIPILSGASSVLINGMPAARCCDMGLGVWCGGYFPLYEIFLGSSSVWIESMRAARLAIDITKHCLFTTPKPQDPPMGPVIGFTISASPNVLIGGIPMPSLVASALGRSMKGVFKLTGKGLKAAGGGWKAAVNRFSRNGCLGSRIVNKLGLKTEGLLARRIRKVFGEPIDVATGEYADYRTDFSYDSLLPLVLERVYSGKNRVSGLLGTKWICSWSQRLLYDLERGIVLFEDAEGQRLKFRIPGNTFYHRHHRAQHYTLSGSRREARLFDERSQQTLVFRAASHASTSARLEAIEDRNGHRIDFLYRDDRLVRITHTDGVSFRVETTKEGWLQALFIDGDDAPLVRYAYDAQGQLTDVYSRFFGEFHLTYTPEGWLASWADSGATKAMLTYDSQGRVIATRTNEGSLYDDHFEYFPEERRTRYINALGEVTTFWYNEDNLVVREENGLGQTTETVWDEFERRLSTTDALGRTIRFEYDEDGRLVRETDWAGRQAVYEYDDFGTLTALSDTAGETRWIYDERGNLIESALPDGRRIRYGYDERGRLRTTTFPDGSIEHWEYTPSGRVETHVDALGHVTRFQQDIWGRIIAVTDAKGHTSRYEYALGPTNPRAALSRVIHPDGGEERFAYDSENCLSRHIGAEGQTTRYRHGAYDLLRSVVDPLGYTTRLDYDGAARLSRITNAAGQHWRFQYDAAGRLMQETDWGGRTTSYRRDAVGRVIVKRLPDGSEHRIDWDERDRIAAVTAGRQRIAYGYDEKDRLIRAATYVLAQSESEAAPEPETEVSFQYDASGRLIREVQNGVTIDYRYDEMGRLIGRSSPSGETTWRFDTRGLLESLNSNGHGLEFGRDALGLERRRELRPRPALFETPGNGVKPGRFFLQQDYDTCGRLAGQSAGMRLPQAPGGFPESLSTPSVVRRFHWDKSGRLTGLDDSLRGGIGYRYDPRDQITAVQRESGRSRLGPEQYGYDGLMNLISSGPERLHSYARGCV
ncbi:MAG: hypothetical protein JXR29_06450, partial [Methylothermaceae bacterium]|nr:hypothetical protein [Methylothermaceae bacterium]